MSYKQLKKKEEGFTIIEVLIVLAIAGLIMVIVFLAVPALQRNSRNTQRSNDVQSVLGGIQEYVAAHNGSIPSNATEQSEATGNARLGYYKTADVSWASGAQGALAISPPSDTLRIVTSAKCGTSGATTGGASRQVAIQYLNEGTNFSAKCQDF